VERAELVRLDLEQVFRVADVLAQGRRLPVPEAIKYALHDVWVDGRGHDNGPAVLTGREQDVTALVTLGLTNRQIGERMWLAEKTVRNYVSNVLAKLGARDRTQAALIARELVLLVERLADCAQLPQHATADEQHRRDQHQDEALDLVRDAALGEEDVEPERAPQHVRVRGDAAVRAAGTAAR